MPFLSERLCRLIIKHKILGTLFACRWVKIAGHWHLLLLWNRDVYVNAQKKELNERSLHSMP